MRLASFAEKSVGAMVFFSARELERSQVRRFWEEVEAVSELRTSQHHSAVQLARMTEVAASRAR
eukprot:5577030-Lingulodinium_polyedra.AAC.1